MASVTNDKGPDGPGRSWRIQLSGRKSLRFIGSRPKPGHEIPDDVKRFKERCERLEMAKAQAVAPDLDIVRWIMGMPDDLHARFVRVGLAEPRVQPDPEPEPIVTVKALLDEFFKQLEVKPITRLGYECCRDALTDHFGESADVKTISPLTAQQWRNKLSTTLATATISKRVAVAKQIFNFGVDMEWLPKNPFAKLKGGSQTNQARQFFITRNMAGKIMTACPSLEWRLIFALSRYGGLRCPSEHSNLKWTDILWDLNRIRVTCSKTERHEGRAERFVPLFPEIDPLLSEAHQQAPEGSEYVLPRLRGAPRPI